MDRRLYWLWLAAGLGFAPQRLHGLMETYQEVEEIFCHRMELLRRRLVSPAQQRALAGSQPQEFAGRLQEHLDAGYQVLGYDDPDYPPPLREISDPPAVLYVQGDLGLIRDKLAIGMIGTRRPSAYGIEAAQFLGRQLAGAGVALISGLADGLDSEAHKAAVAAGTPTVAVLGTAIDRTYPARNETLRGLIAKNGAVISEYPIGTAGKGSYFVLRNRIIAGLSRGVLVVEARMRSGTMSTVRYALESGRDIFAVPGSIFSPLSEGANHLLQEGARPVLRAEDLLEEYGMAPQGEAEQEPQCPAQAEQELPLSDAAKQMRAALTVHPQEFGALCAATGLAAGAAMAALTELELAGLSDQLAGRRFRLAQ